MKVPAARQFLLKNIYRDSNNGFQWRINLPVLIREIHKVGAEIAPESVYAGSSLFVVGEHSPYIKEEDEEQIMDLFPNAEIITAPEAGHWVQVDQPSWLVERVAKFIQEIT